VNGKHLEAHSGLPKSANNSDIFVSFFFERYLDPQIFLSLIVVPNSHCIANIIRPLVWNLKCIVKRLLQIIPEELGKFAEKLLKKPNFEIKLRYRLKEIRL
jgi:hypothetical protein